MDTNKILGNAVLKNVNNSCATRWSHSEMVAKVFKGSLLRNIDRLPILCSRPALKIHFFFFFRINIVII
jgi:hypothetical protein